MGVANSPLRDRVIFVQGAPRSGTSWLAMILATHPQIAGIQAESHLFEYGVNTLFDSFEGRLEVSLPLLKPYLERHELVDLARELCDGVFLAMRSHVSAETATPPPFVVEKTPTSLAQRSQDLRRKRECYPDAWYLHIVRDSEAVTRSLMRASWMTDRSHANCERTWRECIEFTRESLGDHPRYRELSYEEMRADPARVGADLFGWLGVDSNEEILSTVTRVSRERFSEHGALPPAGGPGGGLVGRARRAASSSRRAVSRARHGLRARTTSQAATQSPLAFNFVRALGERDLDALRTMTSESVALVYRSGEGDHIVSGDEARTALVAIGGQLFSRRHINARWAAAQGGPREWWTSAPRQPLWTIFFSALAGDATRVDVAFALTLEEELIVQVNVLSTGPLSGRPLRELSNASEPVLVSSAGSVP